MKICSKCGVEKDLSEFNNTSRKKKQARTGDIKVYRTKNNWCKLCTREYNKQYKKNNIQYTHDYAKEYGKLYRKLNTSKAKKYQSDYYLKNKGIILERAKDYYKGRRDIIIKRTMAYAVQNPNKRKIYSKNYRINNTHKSKEYFKHRMIYCPEKVRYQGRENAKKQRTELSISYVKRQLKVQGWPNEYISNDLIELKKSIIKIKRYVKSKNKAGKEPV